MLSSKHRALSKAIFMVSLMFRVVNCAFRENLPLTVVLKLYVLCSAKSHISRAWPTTISLYLSCHEIRWLMIYVSRAW